jgi:2-phospho-L-lactate guanylyltransferase
MIFRQPLWALVAIRSSAGKQRLAGVLDEGQRRELVMVMAGDVLSALLAAPEITRVALVTEDAELGELAQALGAQVIPDPGQGGLNGALSHGRDVLVEEGAQSLLIVHGDVPAITSADIAALCAAHDGGVTIARATSDGGTNGLLLTPPEAIALHFGPDSCAAHLAAAEKAGFAAKVLAIAGLSHDIDEPRDLGLLAASASDGKAARLARAWAAGLQPKG